MAAIAQKSALVQTRVVSLCKLAHWIAIVLFVVITCSHWVAQSQAVRPSRAAVVVRAQAQETSSRRSLLGFVAAGVCLMQ